jgi:hypothetical protein
MRQFGPTQSSQIFLALSDLSERFFSRCSTWPFPWSFPHKNFIWLDYVSSPLWSHKFHYPNVLTNVAQQVTLTHDACLRTYTLEQTCILRIFTLVWQQRLSAVYPTRNRKSIGGAAWDKPLTSIMLNRQDVELLCGIFHCTCLKEINSNLPYGNNKIRTFSYMKGE